jgi:chromosome segregation ATPase
LRVGLFQTTEASLSDARNEINCMKPELQVMQEKLVSTNKQLHETRHALKEEQERRESIDDLYSVAQEEIVRIASELKSTQSETADLSLRPLQCIFLIN